MHLEVLQYRCSSRISLCNGRVLLYGVPTDKDAAANLQESAAQIAQDIRNTGQGASVVPQDKQSQEAWEALLAALMTGLATLTEAQLHVAAREVLRLAGGSDDDTAIGQLCKKMRSANVKA